MKDFDNVGILDTAVRSIISVILLALAVEGLFSIPVSLILAVAGLLLWATASTGVCLLYKLVGLDTYHHKSHS